MDSEKEGIAVDELLEADIGAESVLRQGVALLRRLLSKAALWNVRVTSTHR